jgi:MFS family permease
VGLLTAALFLGQSLVSLPAGFLADRFGSRHLLMGLALCLGCGFSIVAQLHAFWWMFFFIVLGGMGYGAMHPVSNRGIIYWFPLRRRGTAMGLKQMGVTVGSALAVMLLLPLALKVGWRLTMVAACLVLIGIGVAAWWGYRDVSGSESGNTLSFRSFFVSVVKMARHRRLLAVSLSSFGLSAAQMCLTTYAVFFGHEQLGYSLVVAGLLLLTSEVGGSVGRVLWGIISDRLFGGGRVIVLLLITLLTALCSTVAAFLPAGVPLWLILPFVAVFGFGIAGFNGIWMNAAAESVPKQWAGLASGFSISVGSWGVIVGPPVFGWLVDWSRAYTVPWLFVTALMALVVGLLLWAMAEDKAASRR